MIKRALMGAAAVFVVACNSGPSQTPENTVGGANVVSFKEAPLKKGTTDLTLDWGSKGQAGQVAIAVVLSYGGSKPTITAPAGWQLIRDDSTKTTRQSLYWHAIQASDASTRPGPSANRSTRKAQSYWWTMSRPPPRWI